MFNCKLRAFFICSMVLLVVGCSTQKTFNAVQDDIYIFVQQTDNHLGNSTQGSEITIKLIDEINQYKEECPIDFVVFTGDLIDDGKYDQSLEDCRAIQEKSSYPVYFIPGNNEFDIHGRATDKEVFFKNIKTWKENFGEIKYSVDIRNVRFVFVSLEELAFEINEEGDVYEWLETELREADCLSKDVILFTHVPIVYSCYNGRMCSPYPMDDYRRLEGLINKYHVNAVISGHFHDDQLDMAGNAPVYICPKSVDYSSGTGSFRVYKYNAGTGFMTYKTWDVK